MIDKNLNPNSFILIENVCDELNVSYGDINTIISLHNVLHQSQKIDNSEDLIRDEESVLIKYSAFTKIQNCYEKDIIKIAELEKITGISAGDIKHMCDICYDDRYNSLIPDDAKIRPVSINGEYYITRNYIEHFKDRYAKFNEIENSVLEQAQEFEKEELERINNKQENIIEESDEQQKEETASEETGKDETEEEFSDEDKNAERARHRREINKKANEEYRKRYAEQQKQYEKELANSKMIAALEAERMTNESSSPYSSDNSDYNKRLDEEKIKLENIKAENKKLEENKKKAELELENSRKEFEKHIEENKKNFESFSEEQKKQYDKILEEKRIAYEKSIQENKKIEEKLNETRRQEYIKKQETENLGRVNNVNSEISQTNREIEKAKEEIKRIENDKKRYENAKSEEDKLIARRREEDARAQQKIAEERIKEGNRKLAELRAERERLDAENSAIKKMHEAENLISQKQASNLARANEVAERERLSSYYANQASDYSNVAENKRKEAERATIEANERFAKSKEMADAENRRLKELSRKLEQEKSDSERSRIQKSLDEQKKRSENAAVEARKAEIAKKEAENRANEARKIANDATLASLSATESLTSNRNSAGETAKYTDKPYISQPQTSNANEKVSQEQYTNRYNTGEKYSTGSTTSSPAVPKEPPKTVGNLDPSDSQEIKNIKTAKEIDINKHNDYTAPNPTTKTTPYSSNSYNSGIMGAKVVYDNDIQPHKQNSAENSYEKTNYNNNNSHNSTYGGSKTTVEPKIFESEKSKVKSNDSFATRDSSPHTTNTSTSTRITGNEKSGAKSVGSFIAQGASPEGTDAPTATKMPPIKQMKSYSDAYTKIDYGAISDSFTNRAGRSIARGFAKTEVGSGITKVARTINFFMPSTSSRGESIAATTEFLKRGVAADYLEAKTIGNSKQSLRVMMNAADIKSRTVSDDANAVIRSINNNMLREAGIKNPEGLTSEHIKQIAKDKNIKLFNDVHHGYGISINKHKQGFSNHGLLDKVKGKETNSFEDFLRANGIKSVDDLTTKNLMALSNKTTDAKFLKEIKQNMTLNGMIRKAKANGMNLDTDEGVAQFIGTLASQKDGKQLQRIMMARTGNGGFSTRFGKINLVNVNGRKLAMTAEMQADEGTLAQAISMLSGVRISTLRGMTTQKLLDLKHGMGVNDKDLKVLLSAYINIRLGTDALSKSFAQNILNGARGRIRKLLRSYRRMASQDVAMSSFFEMRDKLMRMRRVHNVKKSVKKFIKKRRLKIRRGGTAKLDRKRNSLLSKGKSTKGIDKKIANKKEQIKKLRRKDAKDRLKNIKKNAKKKRRKELIAKPFNKLNGKLKNTAVGRGLGAVKKGLNVAKAFMQNTRLFRALQFLMRAIKAVLDALKAVMHYIILGVIIIVLVIISINGQMFIVGSVGGTISDFFGNFWNFISPYEDIMNTKMGNAIGEMHYRDNILFAAGNNTAKHMREDNDPLAAVGINNVYGFIEPKDGSSIPNRYKISKPGYPYGTNGYEQHYYSYDGKEIARYSNTKSITSVSYWAYDGKAAKWFSSYAGYNRDLWDLTHYCKQCGKYDNWNAIGDSNSLFAGKFIGNAFGLNLGEIQLHCHVTNVYACPGDCDGSEHKYTYYCDVGKSGTSSEHKNTHWVYSAKIWKNTYTLNPQTKADENKYLAINGSLSPKKTAGCSSSTCSNNGTEEYTFYVVKSGNNYVSKQNKPSSGSYETVKKNINKLYGTQDDGKKDYCKSYTVSYCTPTNATNGTCSNRYYVEFDDCVDKTWKCSNKTFTSLDGKIYYNIVDGYCISAKPIYDVLVDCKNKCNDAGYYEVSSANITAYTDSKMTKGKTTFTLTNVQFPIKECDHASATTEFVEKKYSIRKNGVVYYFKYKVKEPKCEGMNTTIYKCGGHTCCTGHWICGGHRKCKTHNYCPGHNVKYCLGHVNAYSAITIVGLGKSESETKEMFRFASLTDSNANTKSVRKRIKNSDSQELAKSLYEEDWAETYGIEITSSELVSERLLEREVEEVVDKLKKDDKISDKSLEILRMALKTIAVIPNYERKEYSPTITKKIDETGWEEQFQHSVVVSGKTMPDKHGNVMNGLKGKDYAAYVLWSANIGSGTSMPSFDAIKSNLKKVSDKSKLLPGDIIYDSFSNRCYIVYETDTYEFTGVSGSNTDNPYSFNKNFGFVKCITMDTNKRYTVFYNYVLLSDVVNDSDYTVYRAK